ncbi:hypothetical protein RJT34_10513 [Clitoria ternatea]|uniref:Signal peptidase complex subunit 1 n=1 Tax=Clitoria ternatea TaxID=43366 RepID=A0AAN9K658_CLITE
MSVLLFFSFYICFELFLKPKQCFLFHILCFQLIELLGNLYHGNLMIGSSFERLDIESCCWPFLEILDWICRSDYQCLKMKVANFFLGSSCFAGLRDSCFIAEKGVRLCFMMDWQGQKLAEQLMQIMLLALAVIAFATGYLMASFQMMILIYAGGVILTTLVTVPNWPFFNRHPLKWLDPSEVEKASKATTNYECKFKEETR